MPRAQLDLHSRDLLAAALRGATARGQRTPTERDLLDAIWEGGEAGEPAAEIARRVGLNDEQVENTLFDIKRKQATTEYLRMEPLAPAK